MCLIQSYTYNAGSSVMVN